jgi:hypothetical protein
MKNLIYSSVNPSNCETLNPIFWSSMIKDRKVSGVLGTIFWVAWVYKKLQPDQFCLACISLINLVHILQLGKKMYGKGY